MEVGDSRESAECHGRSDFGSGKGVTAIGIRKAWREQGRFRGGDHGSRSKRGEAGNIGIMGQKPVTPRWDNDPLQRFTRHQWKGCGVRKGAAPPEVHQLEGREGGAGQI